MSAESEFKPFVSAEKKAPEMGWVPLAMGALLGIIFGSSSVYLALKIGMTVSASIPIAVLSITLFRAFTRAFGMRPATILENNLVQTTGSAGESIAFGVAVTMPALLILGYNLEADRVMVVSVFGALLGILMMIPMRWALIVKEHGVLKYPEGTACAEVLIAGEKGGSSAVTVFTGFFVGLFYKVLNLGAKLWMDVPEKVITSFKGASFATEVSPELLGVGYIIGTATAAQMVAGGVLSSFVLTPAIALFGDQLQQPLFPGTQLISKMSSYDIWKSYVLYIGAGAVAAGGIVSLVRSLPTIYHSFIAGFASIKASGTGEKKKVVLRTEKDISIKWVVFGILGLILALALTPMLHIGFFGAILMMIFGFLFVTVSSRVTGEVGSSSNPISGMTVATLLLTCLVFLFLGWIGPEYRVAALSIAAVVCIASSNAGTTAQDLKTGYIVGATPRAQQIGILIGSLTSAAAIGYTLLLLNNASTIYHKVDFPGFTVDVSKIQSREKLKGSDANRDPGEYASVHFDEPRGEVPAGRYLVDPEGHLKYLVDPGINGVLKTRDDGTPVAKYEAPKARLMSLIIDGILTQKLPWGLVLLGVFISLTMELCGVSSLVFAVGVYLPLSSSTPIFFGGLIRWLAERSKRRSKTETESDSSPAVLLSSGLIAGGSIAGITLAIISINDRWRSAMDFSAVFPYSADQLFPYIPFAAMGLLVLATGRGWIFKSK